MSTGLKWQEKHDVEGFEYNYKPTNPRNLSTANSVGSRTGYYVHRDIYVDVELRSRILYLCAYAGGRCFRRSYDLRKSKQAPTRNYIYKKCREFADSVIRSAEVPDINEIRKAVANYVASEGCNCCEGPKHKEHYNELAKAVKIKPKQDNSGELYYDISEYNVNADRWK